MLSRFNISCYTVFSNQIVPIMTSLKSSLFSASFSKPKSSSMHHHNLIKHSFVKRLLCLVSHVCSIAVSRLLRGLCWMLGNAFRILLGVRSNGLRGLIILTIYFISSLVDAWVWLAESGGMLLISS